MASGINKVILIGNVGKDPEVRYAANGSAIANVSIATSESWKDKQTGEKKEVTDWHHIVFYNKLAEIVQQYVSKGTKIYIEGKLKNQKWQDKETGQDRYRTIIQAISMQLLGGGASQKSDNSSQQQVNHENDDFDDDIPF